MEQLAESDWKPYKKVFEPAKDRLYERLIKEIIAIATNKEVPAVDRYWDLQDHFKESNKDIETIFGRYSRSNANLSLLLMRRYQLVTDEEMLRFSKQTQDRVASIMGRED